MCLIVFPVYRSSHRPCATQAHSFFKKTSILENTAKSLPTYFRLRTVLYNRLTNKHLTEYLKSNGNDLATVLFSALCGALLSNNSLCKSSQNP